MRVYNARQDLELDTYASAEAQVAALSDDIAYNNHDIDDGLRAELFSLDDLRRRAARRAGAQGGRRRPIRGSIDHRTAHEIVRRLINRMINDVIEETGRRIAELNPQSAEAVRHLGRPLAGFTEVMASHDKALKAFLSEHMYRHYRVNRMASKARRVVADLFVLVYGGARMPADPMAARGRGRRGQWKATAARARLVADFIAGMTDRYALSEHKRLFDLTAIDV